MKLPLHLLCQPTANKKKVMKRNSIRDQFLKNKNKM